MIKPLRSIVTIDFASHGVSGPASLSSGVARVYRTEDTTPTTTGVTLTTDVDAKIGQNRITIDTGNDTAFFNGEIDCSVRVEGTIDGEALAGIVGEFQLRGMAGAVVDDAANSPTTFKTDLIETVNDHYKDCLLKFTGGALAGQVKEVSGYNGTTKFITVTGGFTAEPTADDPFEIVNS